MFVWYVGVKGKSNKVKLLLIFGYSLNYNLSKIKVSCRIFDSDDGVWD